MKKRFLSTFLLINYTALAHEPRPHDEALKLHLQKQEEQQRDFFIPHQDLDPENWESLYEKREKEEKKMESLENK